MRTTSPVLTATVFALFFMTSAFAADQQDAEAAAVSKRWIRHRLRKRFTTVA